MSDTPRIVGVGHNCLDYLCTVEAYPPEDGSTHITGMTCAGGGAAATAMAAAARLGVSAGMIDVVGRDGTGREICRLLESDGVDTRFIRAVPEGRSSVSYVMIDPAKGSRTKFPYPASLPPIGWDGEQVRALQSAQALHLDGTRYDDALQAAKLAKAAGVTVSLDGCSMQKDNGKNRVLASMSDILIMNYRYPVMVTGIDDYEAALLEMSRWGPQVVIGTQGARGCLAVIGGKVRRFPAYPVPVADTTGAGDVFHGAFLAGRLRGLDLEQNIRFAAAAAALKCEKLGGRAGIPSWEEAMAFLERQE